MVEEDAKWSRISTRKRQACAENERPHATSLSNTALSGYTRQTHDTCQPGANMAFRGTVFPLIFGGTLILFGFGFYHRYKLIINTEEQAQRKEYNIHKALEFRRTVKEKIDEKKSDR